VDDALLAEAILGGGLPPEAEQHLTRAGQLYHDDVLAEAHLREAAALAPQHAAVLIGRYRFYFYKGRLREALAVARTCIAMAAQDIGLDPDWRRVQRGDAAFGSFEALAPRFYLFTLKAYAYLHMRLGELEQGKAAATKLLELDPGDKLGGSVLLAVLERMGRDDDDA
jgi:tetratricopeptide (TPR) repeat protein